MTSTSTALLPVLEEVSTLCCTRHTAGTKVSIRLLMTLPRGWCVPVVVGNSASERDTIGSNDAVGFLVHVQFVTSLSSQVFPAGRKDCMPDSDISIVKCELGDPADVRCPVK